MTSRQYLGPTPPHLIESEIELFLDNFKYMTSLFDDHDSATSPADLALLDCRLRAEPGRRRLLRISTVSTSSSSTSSTTASSVSVSWSTSASGPKQSVTSPSDNKISSVTSSLLSTDVTSFEFEEDPPPSLASAASFIDENGIELLSSTDNLMGESACTLTVVDVAEVLQDNYAFISGGKSRRSYSLLTFPECPAAGTITDQQHRDVVTYLTSIPTVLEAELGFVVIIDRRLDKWGSVKTLLLRISGHFPALLQKIYVLRPSSFLQKTFADVGLKFLKDDFRFKVLILSTIEELHDHLDRDQLTVDLGGSLPYNNSEWIQHRAALEKFSANTGKIAEVLRELCARLQETEFPNDVPHTEALICDHDIARLEVKEDLESTVQHGRVLLDCFTTMKGEEGEEIQVLANQLPPCRKCHLTAVERLLIQLTDAATSFDAFWANHKQKLHQCLQLRKFEEEFKHLQFVGEKHLSSLESMTDMGGDSLIKVEQLLAQLQQFETASKGDIERGEDLRVCGEKFIDANHYAVDCIRPKCAELQRISDQYRSVLAKRFTFLLTAQELLSKIDKANRWCTRGVDLLANQVLDKCNSEAGAQAALAELEEFVESGESLKLGDPKQFRESYENVLCKETLIASRTVLARLEDVTTMCDKRRASLRLLVDRPARPVQYVHPEPASPVTTFKAGQGHKTGRHSPVRGGDEDERQGRPSSIKFKPGVKLMRAHSKSTFFLNSPEKDSPNAVSNTIQEKRSHVMQELIETEKIYVEEIKSILQGYAWQMDRPEMQRLIPAQLKDSKEILFGNLDEIYNFHAKVFLKELEDCREKPTVVGRCFMNRKEEFQMYSIYCQNKSASEELRRKIGDNNAFFKECQKKLDHKLPLGAYLLKPVQRITKYQLLLKEMLKYAQCDAGCEDLQDALNTMLCVVKHVNDIMHQIAIKGFEGELEQQGRLLMQGSFNIWTEHKKNLRDIRFKPMSRHVFLYENSILFCKKKDDPQNAEKASYVFKSSLKTSQIGLTETVKGDKKKFEVWLHGRSQVYIIQAPSVEVKNVWATEIKNVLLNQFDAIRASAVSKNGVTDSLEHSQTPLEQSTDQMTNNHANHDDNDDDDDYAFCTNNNLSPTKFPCKSPVKSPVKSVRSFAPDSKPHKNTPAWARLGRSPTVDAYISTTNLSDVVGRESKRSSASTTTSQSEQDIDVQLYETIGCYVSMRADELTVNEGETVRLLSTGSEGWWLVHVVQTGEEGWLPASYLVASPARRTTFSLQSINNSSSCGSVGLKSPGEEGAPVSLLT